MGLRSGKMIAKIVDKADDDILFKGQAGNRIWTVVPESSYLRKEIKVGDYVWCNSCHDSFNDEFYLEEIPNQDFATVDEWEKQEK